MHSVDAKKVVMKVDFKIGLINSQNENVIDVKFAWEVMQGRNISSKTYQIPRFTRSAEQCFHAMCVFQKWRERSFLC